MVDEEENKRSGEVGGIKSLSTIKSEGFSEVGNLGIIISNLSLLLSLFALACPVNLDIRR